MNCRDNGKKEVLESNCSVNWKHEIKSSNLWHGFYFPLFFNNAVGQFSNITYRGKDNNIVYMYLQIFFL